MQRNVHSSVVDGLVLSGMRPTFVAPELDPELGIAHGLTPESLAAALEATPGRGRGDGRLAHLLRRLRRRRRAGRGRPRARRAADRRRGLGRAPALPPRRCPPTRSPAAPTWSPPRPTRSSAASPRRRCSTSATAAGSTPRWSTAASAWSRRPAPAACSPARSTPPAARPRCTGRELLDETLAAIAATRAAIAADPRPRGARRRAWSAGPASPAATRCGSSIDVRGIGSTGYRLAQELFHSHGIDLELALRERRRRDLRRSASRPRPAGERLVAALREAVAGLEAEPGPPQAKLAPPPPWGELVMTPREAFLGPQEVIPFDARRRPRRRRGPGRLPARDPQRAARRAAERRDPRLHPRLVAHGGYVRGGSDRELRTLRVARERHPSRPAEPLPPPRTL